MENEMEFDPNLSPEERLAKLAEKAEKEARAALEKLTPEERRRAEEGAKKYMEEESRKNREFMEKIEKLRQEQAEREKAKPKFCTNCGAPVSGGKFCENCGAKL